MFDGFEGSTDECRVAMVFIGGLKSRSAADEPGMCCFVVSGAVAEDLWEASAGIGSCLKVFLSWGLGESSAGGLIMRFIGVFRESRDRGFVRVRGSPFTSPEPDASKRSKSSTSRLEVLGRFFGALDGVVLHEQLVSATNES